MKVTHTLNVGLFSPSQHANHDNNMSGKLEMHFSCTRVKKVSLITDFALITWLKGNLLTQVNSPDSIHDLSHLLLTHLS